jgi:hypothetical protein
MLLRDTTPHSPQSVKQRGGSQEAAATPDHFASGIDDLIIIPGVAIVLGVRRMLRALGLAAGSHCGFRVPGSAAGDAVSFVHVAHCR